MTPARASVLIRSKDEGASIGRTLELIAGQSEPALEVILVDSGSRDDTVGIARAAGARIIEIPASDFTYGRALNIGCEAATGEFVVALSAHAFPPDPDWLARMVATLDDPRVACACGQAFGPDGAPIDQPVRQDASLVRRQPFFGFSNAAGGFRRQLWEQRGFREEMPGTEDKEWSLFWLDKGYLCVIASELAVEHDHSKDSLPEQYRRALREWWGLAMAMDGIPGYSIPEYPLGAMLREWWSEQDSYRSASRARLSHRRAARLIGKYVGRRRPV